MMHRVLRTLFVVIPAVSFSYCCGMDEKNPESWVVVDIGPKNGLKEKLDQEQQPLLPANLSESKKKNVDYDYFIAKRKELRPYYKNGKVDDLKAHLETIKQEIGQDNKQREAFCSFFDEYLYDACGRRTTKNSDGLVAFFVEQGVKLNKVERMYSSVCPFLRRAALSRNFPMVQALVGQGAIIEPETLSVLNQKIMLNAVIGFFCCSKKKCSRSNRGLRQIKDYLTEEKGLRKEDCEKLYKALKQTQQEADGCC
jgi:hypothetical protein